jgi:ATP adenylyltransferase
MQPNDCPFCRANNLLKGDVITESPNAYLIENPFAPGNYLIIPNTHIEAIQSLPGTWWEDVKQLMEHIPGLTPAYNLSMNIGGEAGQSIKHVHLWVIPRIAGKTSSGKGLMSLLDEYDSGYIDQTRSKE